MPSLATSFGPSTSHLMRGSVGQLLAASASMRRAWQWLAGRLAHSLANSMPGDGGRAPARSRAAAARRRRTPSVDAARSCAARAWTWWWCRRSWRRPRPARPRAPPARRPAARSTIVSRLALGALARVDGRRHGGAHAHAGSRRRPPPAPRAAPRCLRGGKRAAACRACRAGRRPCAPAATSVDSASLPRLDAVRRPARSARRLFRWRA